MVVVCDGSCNARKKPKLQIYKIRFSIFFFAVNSLQGQSPVKLWRMLPMKIPNSYRAVIEPSKLTEYLLNTEHKRGGTKAKLLLQFGYSPDNWQQLESDIRKFHLTVDVNLIKETTYGTRYEVSANLLTPINRLLLVKTVWQIDTGTDFPRLITLFPD